MPNKYIVNSLTAILAEADTEAEAIDIVEKRITEFQAHSVVHSWTSGPEFKNDLIPAMKLFRRTLAFFGDQADFNPRDNYGIISALEGIKAIVDYGHGANFEYISGMINDLILKYSGKGDFCPECERITTDLEALEKHDMCIDCYNYERAVNDETE